MWPQTNDRNLSALRGHSLFRAGRKSEFMSKQREQNRGGHDSLTDLLFEIALDAVMEYLTMGSGSLQHSMDEFFNHVLEALGERQHRHGQQQNRNNNNQSVVQYVSTLGFSSQQPSVSIMNYTWEDETGHDEQTDYPDKFRPYIATKYNFY